MPVPYYFLYECRVGPQRQCVTIMIGAVVTPGTLYLFAVSPWKWCRIPVMVAIMIFYTCILMKILNYDFLKLRISWEMLVASFTKPSSDEISRVEQMKRWKDEIKRWNNFWWPRWKDEIISRVKQMKRWKDEISVVSTRWKDEISRVKQKPDEIKLKSNPAADEGG